MSDLQIGDAKTVQGKLWKLVKNKSSRGAQDKPEQAEATDRCEKAKDKGANHNLKKQWQTPHSQQQNPERSKYLKFKFSKA